MKRSEINALMRKATDFFAEHHFQLPPFAFWTPAEWARKGPEVEEIRRNQLGWDLTDFGSGDFHAQGLLLFNLRNGNLQDPEDLKPYAEKVMIVEEDQVTPWHHHGSKIEDIINRGGGHLVIEVAPIGPHDTVGDTPVTFSVDGVQRTVPARSRVILTPGESIALPPTIYHSFYGEAGSGTVLVGEVSAVNDDQTDNYFAEPLPRFPEIEEDEEPRYLLVGEYPPATGN